MKDALAFLEPTSFRFPRKTTVLGGSNETPSTSFSQARTSTAKTATTEDDEWQKNPFELDDEASGSTVYSFVCIFQILLESEN